MLTEHEVGSGPTPEPHAVMPIVEHVVRMLGPTLPKNVSLGVEAADTASALTIHMEPLELQQVMIQLVLNAREAHRDAPGAIAIAVDRCDGTGPACSSCSRLLCGAHVRLGVRDAGAGIDGDVLSRIFEPFFTTKAADNHAGLGLTIVQALTHKAGGHLRVFSAPHRGTTVEILWPDPGPAADNTPPPAPRYRIDTRAEPDKQPRTWVVSEDWSTALHLVDLLRADGIDVRSFTCAAECLRALIDDPHAVDVVLADHGSSRLSGPAMIRSMLALRPDLLCILCTNHGQLDQEQNAREAGARALLRKPFSVADLLRTVRCGGAPE